MSVPFSLLVFHDLPELQGAKKICLRFSLKNGLRRNFDSVACVNYSFGNLKPKKLKPCFKLFFFLLYQAPDIRLGKGINRANILDLPT